MTAHMLMLGLIDGASVGMTVEPPATVGELEGVGVESFYTIDYPRENGRRVRRTQPMSTFQYKRFQQLVAIQRRSRLQTVRDYAHSAKLMRSANKAVLRGR